MRKSIKQFFTFLFLSIILLVLCGCSTLSYVGEDYNQQNIQTVKTNEDFVFNVYKKSIDNANVKIGITRTPVPEILALYIQVENLSYETPYIFKVEDLNISNPDRELQFITTSNYLNIYQTQEASSMAAMSSMGATLTNMTGMTSNYNEFNQSMVQNSSEQSNKSVFSKIEEIGNQISKHSIKYSSTISPRKSQYFYFFFEDLEKFPKAKYKLPVIATKSGIVNKLNAEEVGKIAMKLGAGRLRKEDEIIKEVGIELNKKVGNNVEIGDILAYIHGNNEELTEKAVIDLRNVYEIE